METASSGLRRQPGAGSCNSLEKQVLFGESVSATTVQSSEGVGPQGSCWQVSDSQFRLDYRHV